MDAPPSFAWACVDKRARAPGAPTLATWRAKLLDAQYEPTSSSEWIGEKLASDSVRRRWISVRRKKCFVADIQVCVRSAARRKDGSTQQTSEARAGAPRSPRAGHHWFTDAYHPNSITKMNIMVADIEDEATAPDGVAWYKRFGMYYGQSGRLTSRLNFVPTSGECGWDDGTIKLLGFEKISWADIASIEADVRKRIDLPHAFTGKGMAALRARATARPWESISPCNEPARVVSLGDGLGTPLAALLSLDYEVERYEFYEVRRNLNELKFRWYETLNLEEHYDYVEAAIKGDYTKHKKDTNVMVITIPCDEITCIGEKEAHVETFDELLEASPSTAAGLLSAYLFALHALRTCDNITIVYELNAPKVPQVGRRARLSRARRDARDVSLAAQHVVDVVVRTLGPEIARFVTRICASHLSPMKQDRYIISNKPFGRPRSPVPTPTVEQWLSGVRSSVSKLNCLTSGANTRHVVPVPSHGDGKGLSTKTMKDIKQIHRSNQYLLLEDEMTGVMRPASTAELEILKGIPTNFLCDQLSKTEAIEAMARALSGHTLRYLLGQLEFKRRANTTKS